MGGIDTNLAATALAIALVALVISLGQLLQQYFSTADGYRNCQRPVMAGWSDKTRLRFRWREFRFETLFTTPEIFMTGFINEQVKLEGRVQITGGPSAREQTFTPLEAFEDSNQVLRRRTTFSRESREQNLLFALSKTLQNPVDELVCWLPLLDQLHRTTQASLDIAERPADRGATDNLNNFKIVPALKFREHSWDFQPPDVARPLAKSSVSTIAILARRMGMRWKEFRPQDGIMQAEGRSHIITSTSVKSLGVVLQYSYSGQSHSLPSLQSHSLPSPKLGKSKPGKAEVKIGTISSERDEIYIATKTADRMGFGLVGGHKKLGTSTFSVGTQHEIVKALAELDKSGESATQLQNILRDVPAFTFRVADIVAMSTEMAHQLGSTLVQIPAPSDNMHGFTTTPSGRSAFHRCLKTYLTKKRGQARHALLEPVSNHPDGDFQERITGLAHTKPDGIQTERILELCVQLKQFSEWDTKPESSTRPWKVRREREFLDVTHRCCDTLTDYLSLERAFDYTDLLSLYIRRAIFRPLLSGQRETQKWPAEVDLQYQFDRLPLMIEELTSMLRYSDHDSSDPMGITTPPLGDDGVNKPARKKTIVQPDEIVDVFVSMLFRGCCWGACHYFVEGERVPVAYYGSQLPVYIG